MYKLLCASMRACASICLTSDYTCERVCTRWFHKMVGRQVKFWESICSVKTGNTRFTCRPSILPAARLFSNIHLFIDGDNASISETWRNHHYQT